MSTDLWFVVELWIMECILEFDVEVRVRICESREHIGDVLLNRVVKCIGAVGWSGNLEDSPSIQSRMGARIGLNFSSISCASDSLWQSREEAVEVVGRREG
jgi:hypothetical protein